MAKKTYTPAPIVPPELQDRYQAILEVLSGQTSVAAAARKLGMSRNHFQTLLHRGLAGLLEAITPARAGRPAKPETEAKLEAQRDAALRRTAHLERRLDMTTRLMALAGEVMRGSVPRSRAKRRATTAMASPDDDQDEPISVRELALQVEQVGLPRALAARAFGIAESTLRRGTTTAPKQRPSRSKLPSAIAVAQAVDDIRELRGLVGADSLRRAHPELSRRQAANLKKAIVTTMEHERRAACSKVIVTAPGVIRGFDQLDFGHDASPRYALIAADAAVPYRTSAMAVDRYDGASVARALAADFEQNGAPFVLRLDRAACHTTPDVRAVLDHFGVLPLHGPPRYPRFYGQLERQNRDHRAWLDAAGDDCDAPLQERLERMQRALNDRWRRPQLGWKTPSEAWMARRPIAIERRALHARVAERAARLRASDASDKISEDLAARLAIERELASLGYLRIEIRRQVLGDYRLGSSQL